MEELGLSRDELREIARACAPIRIGGSTPRYLQDFLALRLAGDRPEVSSHIRRLTPQQVDDLRSYLHECQSWLHE